MMRTTTLRAALLACLLAGLPSGSGFPVLAAAPPQPKPAPAEARVLKVLPHFIDHQGRHTLNPSLFDRDAYQFELRQDPTLRGGLRLDVLWKTRPGRAGAFDIKVELRGSKAPQQTPVVVKARAFARGGFSQWTRVPILGADYAALGELLAWRVTLWRDDELLAEQLSFLW